MKKCCEFLREQTIKTILTKKKKVINKKASGIIRKYANILYL